MICAACVSENPLLGSLGTHSDPGASAGVDEGADADGSENGDVDVEIVGDVAGEAASDQRDALTSPVECLDVRAVPDGRALFLADGWRQRLCGCANCREILESRGLGYLYLEEPIYEAEPDADASTPSYEMGTRMLDSLVDRKAALDGIRAVDQLKARLWRFLQPFVEEKRVVTKAVRTHLLKLTGPLGH